MSERNDSVWTVRAVMDQIPEVRRILRLLREAACRLAHSRRMTRMGHAAALDQVRTASKDLADLLRRSASMGFYVYEHAGRGIALFPSYITQNGDPNVPTLFTYHDSRLTIQSYVVVADLNVTCDLVACEKPIPETWYRQEQ